MAAPVLTQAQHIGIGGHIGGAAHMGGGAHFGGAHAAVPGVHMGGTGGAHYAYAPGHVAAGGYAYHGASASGRYGYPAARGGYVARPGYAGGSAYYNGGHYWGGGYWHGGYWPYSYYRPGWTWYYPVLPIGYATFWWGGVPYYYWNNLYYTYNPGYSGYVVTDPPPVAGTADDAGAAPGDDPSVVNAAPPAQGMPPQGFAGGAAGAGADVFVYPRNGQSEAQTNTDRYECHSWAVSQTGFDPTRSGQNGGNPSDYKRAMVACLDARGYSAR